MGSTVSFAGSLDRDLATVESASARAADANEIMWRATQKLLATFFPSGDIPAPVCMQTRRWIDSAHPVTLDLDRDGGSHNEAVTFRQWGLALCGDYLGAQQGMQETIISSISAADRITEWAAVA